MIKLADSGLSALKAWYASYGLPLTYASIDIESDGLDVNRNRPIHVGWCHVVNGKAVRSDGVIIDWTRALDDQQLATMTRNMDLVRTAMAGRGQHYRWTVDDLRTRGVHPKDAAAQIVRSVGHLPLAAHHGWGFDYPMLGNFVTSHGLPFAPPHSTLMDTCLMARAAFGPCPPRPNEPYRSYVQRLSTVRCRRHTLRDCISLFDLDKVGVDPKHTHDAEYDNWVVHLLLEKFRELITA